MTELDTEKLKQELIEVYEGYIRNTNDPNVRKKAQKLFFEYVYSNETTDKELMNAVQGLEHIGWEYSRSTKNETSWKMNENEAIKIANKLKK
jgi:hypothetical protein